MIKQILNSPWGFARWFRLILGAFGIIGGIMQHDSLLGVFGGFFLFQAIMNVGCCGVSACNVDYAAKENNTQEIEFEKVKG